MPDADDIQRDLKRIGITVNKVVLDQKAFHQAEITGDFNVVFTRTWGSPYDPHSYFNSWAVPSHSEYQAAGALEPPLTRDLLLEKIADVQKQTAYGALSQQWREILEDVHKQAMFVPLWGTRVPYVINRRLGGFSPGYETYRYDIVPVRIFSGSTNVTISPGVSGGLFEHVGNLHPHQYGPNQLFSQGWIYETLVGYGQDGTVVPNLATSWTQEDVPNGGEQITFKLRKGVKFHDGTDFNCTVAKLNFDHILSDIVKQRHSWMGTANMLKSWTCNDNGDFVLETKETFYPLLQELSYIRPFTFASAASFEKGLDSHPDDHNSCHPGTLDVTRYPDTALRCAGLSAPSGTGPFRFVERELTADGTRDNKVVFARHDEWWGPKPEIEFVTVPFYEDTEAVEAALLSGELDMSLGIGPLSAKQVQELKFDHSAIVDVQHSDVLQHAILVLNTNKAPTNDIITRQAIIHAIDKARFVEEEFAGLEQPISQLLPISAPYCDVDLSPACGYDIDKALLLNCPNNQVSSSISVDNSSDDLSSGAIAGIAVSATVAALLGIFVIRMIMSEKSGKPMFAPDKTDTGESA